MRATAAQIATMKDPYKRAAEKRALAGRLGRSLSAIDTRVREHLRAAGHGPKKPPADAWPPDLLARLVRLVRRNLQVEDIAHRLGRGVQPTEAKIAELRLEGRLPPAPKRQEHVSLFLGSVPQDFASVLDAVRFVNRVGYYTVTPCRGRWSIDGKPPVDPLQVIDLARFEAAVLTGAPL